jgi:hypothetical protein
MYIYIHTHRSVTRKATSAWCSDAHMVAVNPREGFGDGEGDGGGGGGRRRRRDGGEREEEKGERERARVRDIEKKCC